jgi:serine/threonine-protein kinase
VPALAGSANHADLAFEPGTRISDRYLIEKSIGQGGMGVVYRAQDTLINEPVALKFMNPRMLNTEKGRQLFIQEAQIARRLRHENIVAVHDVATTLEGILYLSMEFLQGRSLRALLRNHRKERRLVAVRLAVSLIKQILSALEYAHRTVIHRDMKPENIMLIASERVKVLDFGLAKAVHEEFYTGESGVAPSRVVGTLAYAAPEQRQKKPIDLRADIYAVGLVFHELLTLRTPMDEPVTVNQVRKDVSPSLLDVLEKALHKEKERRWASAREFREAIEDAYNLSYKKTNLQVSLPARQEEASRKDMIHFEGGSFLMGNNDVREEAPEEEVFVDPFWMDVHPVTVAEYEEFLRETGYPEPKNWRHPQYNGPNQPVVGVSWMDALTYAEWAGKQLPTETQWEFAARGRENRKYPWGNLPPDSTRCNFNDNLGMPSIVSMHDEGKTPEGIYDLAGNVFEWTLDAFAPYSALRRETSVNAPRHVVRGGCWSSPPEELRSTARKGLFPESQLPTVGFRCVIPD